MTNTPAATPPMRVGKWSTKPAGHNATRVRNNQRRHRARVKSRIQDLEARLDEANARLERALSTVASLTAELEALRRGAPVTPVPAAAAAAAALPQPPEGRGSTADCDCHDLPAPAPGESTIPCSSAFQIIEQQNYSGVEVTKIRAWLAPGFRKALKPGESCRVESNRLYELLDHITSTT